MRPARSAIPMFVWGAYLAILTALQAPFHPRAVQVLELGSASAATFLFGAALQLLDRRRRALRGELVAESSFATVAIAVGLAVAVLGASFGTWLLMIGAGLVAVGLGGLVREGRARRALRQRTGGVQ